MLSWGRCLTIGLARTIFPNPLILLRTLHHNRLRRGLVAQRSFLQWSVINSANSRRPAPSEVIPKRYRNCGCIRGLFSKRTKSNDFGITSPKMLLIDFDLTAVSANEKRHCSLTQRPGNSCQTRVVSVDIDLTKSFSQRLKD